MLKHIKPCSWVDYLNNKGLFTWYSCYIHYTPKPLNFFVFIIMHKIILLIQLIIGVDLFLIRLCGVRKIKNIDNIFYKSFISIP